MAVFLITGGGGSIGTHLVRHLKGRGNRLIVLDNRGVNAQMLDAANGSDLSVVDGDVRDAWLMKKVCKNVDYVLHNAAVSSIVEAEKDADETIDTNQNGTGVVLDAAINNGVKRVVFASTAAVYGDRHGKCRETDGLSPQSIYAKSKEAAEQMCKSASDSFGLPVVVLRYFNVYGMQSPMGNGVYASMVNRVRSGKKPVCYGDGGQVRDFVAVEDVVAANVAACLFGGQFGVFNVGTGRGVKIIDLARAAMAAGGIEGEPQTDPAANVGVVSSIADTANAEKWLGFSSSRCVLKDIAMSCRSRQPAM